MNSAQKKRLMWVAGGIWGVAILILIGTYWKPFLPKEARRGPDESYTADGRPLGRMRPDISPEIKQQFIKKARLIRDKWRPWAQAHQADLQRMLDAKIEDSKTYRQISYILPGTPLALKRAGIEPEEVGFIPAGQSQSNPWDGVQIHWADVGNARRVPKVESKDPVTNQLASKYEAALNGRQQEEWQRLRDIPIAGGVSGRTDTAIWASGRITQRTLLSPRELDKSMRKAASERRHMQDSDLYSPYTEIEPPFDFLHATAAL